MVTVQGGGAGGGVVRMGDHEGWGVKGKNEEVSY